MSTMRGHLSLALIVLTSLTGAGQIAFGQSGDAGFAAGGSFYLDRTISGTPGEATVGFEPGIAASAWVGQNLYTYIGGEIRYTFEWNKMKIEAPGASKFQFSGLSHSLHYNFLIHAAPIDAKVRPFLAVGGGIKGYQGTGTEVPDQPGQDIAILTKTSDWKPLIVFGGGIKFAVSDGVLVRVEAYDYFSKAPTKVIQPAPGADFGGWFHNFTPMVGVSFIF